MPTPYTVLRRVYHALVPESVRRTSSFEQVSGWISRSVTTHSELYNEAYFEDIDLMASRSAVAIAAPIIDAFGAGRFIDVGCGTGAVLAALRDRGCDCVGLEYADAGIAKSRARGLDVRKFDLEHHLLDGELGRYDAALCMEVAEHLPASCADGLVELLTALAPVVVFTAAPPGQGGVDHVNEQPHAYWIDKFRARGHEHDAALSRSWSRQWEAGGATTFYHLNLMIFRRGAARNRTGDGG